ncbi:hypothetical protein BN946_scf184990.g4 [Trametes cinnabarina]|uniref:Uncharacterized protein n=1 Tax=Pycnoporus cinnabarinus TaxID=5643 RepID=A0A060SES9_PYCCI|nr:hypothetical protein BN946_scf184990.g4 [Trametes cinnabarina]
MQSATEYWDLGHRLFRSTSESFPAKFVPGDVFDPAHITVTPPFYAPPVDTLPDLSALTSLNPSRGHVSAIHSSAFFHLFDEEKQEHIARAMGGLLSPEPGSIILGTHSASRNLNGIYGQSSERSPKAAEPKKASQT